MSITFTHLADRCLSVCLYTCIYLHIYAFVSLTGCLSTWYELRLNSLFAHKCPKNSKPTGLSRRSNIQVKMPELPTGTNTTSTLSGKRTDALFSKREEKEAKMGYADWLRGVSLPLHGLVNQLTCSQRSLCERTLAVGQSDPQACLSPGGKWCPWYAMNSRIHRQTGRLPAGPLFLSRSLKCPTSLH